MNRRMTGLVVTAAALLATASPAAAGPVANAFRVCSRYEVDKLNQRLAGHVLDFTRNHRSDNRIYCSSLGEKRSLYVYLPPGYDGTTPFPLMIWLHGIAQDEKNFLEFAPIFDAGIRAGLFPPVVIVAPDGTFRGRVSLVVSGSFYMNSKAGRFEDYIAHDVYDFARQSFCLRPEREATVLAGASMGGFAAFNLGFKHRDRFGVLVGILPALDIRYADCHDNYMADYNPACHAYRETMKPHRVVGRFYGVIAVHEHRFTDPTVGRRNPEGMAYFARNNPVELLEALDIRPGEFEMFIGYSKQDEFNLDAQAEHFVDKAARRGIRPAVVCLPDGRHDSTSGLRFLPEFGPWLSRKLARYESPVAMPVGGCTDLLTDRPRLGLFRKPRAAPVWVQSDKSPCPTPATTTPP